MNVFGIQLLVKQNNMLDNSDNSEKYLSQFTKELIEKRIIFLPSSLTGPHVAVESQVGGEGSESSG